MSDTETEVEVEQVEPVESEVTDTDGEEKPTKRQKDELPEGYVTPTGLVHVLKERLSVELAPQQIYGFCYHGKGFPSTQHTDGRYIVPTEDAIEWIKDYLQRAAERKAKRDAKKAAEAVAEAAPVEPTTTATEVADEEQLDF